MTYIHAPSQDLLELFSRVEGRISSFCEGPDRVREGMALPEGRGLEGHMVATSRAAAAQI